MNLPRHRDEGQDQDQRQRHHRTRRMLIEPRQTSWIFHVVAVSLACSPACGGHDPEFRSKSLLFPIFCGVRSMFGTIIGRSRHSWHCLAIEIALVFSGCSASPCAHAQWNSGGQGCAPGYHVVRGSDGGISWVSCAPDGPPSYQPPPDPRAAISERLRQLIAQTADLIDTQTWDGRDLASDAAIAAILRTFHARLWAIRARADAAAANARYVADYYAPYASAMQRTFDATGGGAHLTAQEQSTIERARATVRAARDRLEAERGKASDAAVVGAAIFSGFNDNRNQVYRLLSAFGPANPALIRPPAQRIPPIPAPPPSPVPLIGNYEFAQPIVYAVRPSAPSSGNLVFREAVPAAEPAPYGDADQQIAALQDLANQARAANARAKTETARLDTIKEYWPGLVKSENLHYEKLNDAKLEFKKLLQENDEIHHATYEAEIDRQEALWRNVFLTSKAIVWDIFKKKVLIPEIERTLQAAGKDECLAAISDDEIDTAWGHGRNHVLKAWNIYGRAKSYLKLGQAIRAIETDFEFMSPQVAGYLAMGPTHSAEGFISATWGHSEDAAKHVDDAALKAMGVQGRAIKIWRNLMTWGELYQ